MRLFELAYEHPFATFFFLLVIGGTIKQSVRYATGSCVCSETTEPSEPSETEPF